ncbi:MAG TPA: hypothetical protein VES20_07510 [Bryobacteraceae bacterium]|nr:hypothetical protein [Bryobacteraceae bacterium]
MNKRSVIATLVTCAILAANGMFLSRSAHIRDARAVYQALAEQQYAYEAAHRMAGGTQAEMLTAVRRLSRVIAALRSVSARSDFRAELLQPVLRSLEAEERHLRAAAAGNPVVRPLATDPFAKAMNTLRKEWGLRQRLWRGKPLTA